MADLTNKHSIEQYIHCVLCIEECPDGNSPQENAYVEIGWTKLGLQVWCIRHNCNIVHIDFEGHGHPAEITRSFRKEDIKLVKTGEDDEPTNGDKSD